MKRIVKRVALTIGALFLILIALWYVGFRWGFTPLPKPPRGIRIEPLLPPLARANLKPDNGAFYYVKAAELLTPYKQSKESDQQMDAVLAGDLSGDSQAIEQTLTDCREALDLCREGTRASFTQMPWNDFPANPVDVLSPLRRLARLLVAEGKLAGRNGDSARAVTNYLAVVKLGTDCPRGGTLLLSLVGHAITGMGAQAVRAWALQDATSTEALRKIIDSFSRINKQRVPYAETIRYELIYAKQALDDKEMSGQWEKLNSRRVMFRCFDAAFGDVIQDAGKPFWESNPSAITRKWANVERPIWTWAFNRPLPRILIGMLLPALESARSRAVRAELDLEATAIVCALKAYTLAHGKPPERLGELVPDFLPAIPVDPFDGKPLRYRREGTEWVIWSVGADLKDDNAAWHEFKYRKPGEERTGGDIFFKTTEAKDDLTFHRERKTSRQGS